MRAYAGVSGGSWGRSPRERSEAVAFWLPCSGVPILFAVS